MSLGGDIACLLHEGDLFLILVEPHFARDQCRIFDRMRRICGFQTANTLFCQVTEDLLIELVIDGKTIIKHVVTIKYLAEISGKLLYRNGLVSTIILHHALDALTAAVRFPLAGRARTNVQRERLFRARIDHSDRIGLRKSRQIAKIRVLMKLELRIVASRDLVCRRYDRNGILIHLLDKSL